MHFYTTTTNSRGKQVSAGAHKSQGQETHARGWESGVKVTSVSTGEKDHFHIYMTAGSNGQGSDVYIGSVCEGKFYVREEEASSAG